MLRTAAIALIAMLAATAAASADDHPKDMCLGLGIDRSGKLQAGRITQASTGVISSASPPRSSFATGEPVVIVRTSGAYTCVIAAKPASYRGETSGWIPANHVRVLPTDKSRPTDKWWIGFWKSPRSTILFQIRDHRLWVSGSSTWQGLGEPHFGEFGGHPFAHSAGFRVNDDDTPERADKDLFSGDCQLQMVAVGDRMAVVDSGNCGGWNISFTGFYSRSHPKTHRQ
ncbi:MAG TPA: hypothetical protein VHZ32_07420 [Rhizomicrobium sp.]|jgi:hypothetical protein|nr:hypothetical protein [Rhizomicrobium sp.]